VIISKTSRHFSRARNPLVIAVSAPSSMPPVASQTQCEESRLISIIRIRISRARSGICTPSSFSTPRQYTVSLNSGER